MKQIPFRHIAFSYLLGTACFSAFLLPGAVSAYAGAAAIAVPILSALFSLLFARMVFEIVRVHGTIKHFVICRLGAKGEAVFRALLCLTLFFVCLFYAAAFYDRLASTAFSYLPRAVCICALVLSAALFVGAPDKSVGRAVQVVFLLMLVCLAALAVFSLGSVQVKALLPVKAKSFALFLRAFLYPVGSAGLLTLLLYDNACELPKLSSLRLSVTAANVLMLGMIFFTQSVFGQAFSARVAYPFFALIKSTNSLGGFEHFESLISGAWIVMSVCFFAVLLKTLVGLFLSFFRAAQAQSALLSLVPAAAVLAGALLLPDNRFVNAFVLATLMPLGNTVLLIGMPAVLCLKRANLTLTNPKI